MASTTPLPDGQHDALRRLLALKRHETPPPGYFLGFTPKIITRIEAEELHSPRRLRHWLGCLWEQPSLRGMLGLIMGTLLIAGVGKAGLIEPEGVELDPRLWGAPLAMQVPMGHETVARGAAGSMVLPRFTQISSVAPVLNEDPSTYFNSTTSPEPEFWRVYPATAF